MSATDEYVDKIPLDSFMEEKIILKTDLTDNEFFVITSEKNDNLLKKYYRVDSKGQLWHIRTSLIYENIGEKVVYCRDCAWFDGSYCRHYDFVKKKDGKWKVWDVDKTENDYCSNGEEGEYEPWGFED